MAQSFFYRLWWLFILLLFQILVCNQVHWFGYATPVIYVYMLCIQPLNTSRSAWLLWGFVVGLLADFFSETPGLGTASMVFTSFFAPMLLHLFTPKDSIEDMVPGFRTLGVWNYTWYVVLLVALHQAVFLLLEFLSFFNVKEMLYTYLGSTTLTVLFILALEKMRGRK